MERIQFSLDELHGLKKRLESNGSKDTEEYLKDKGYTHFKEFGWILEPRLQQVMDNGLIKYDDRASQYMLTKVGAKYDTLAYLGGNRKHLTYQGEHKWKK